MSFRHSYLALPLSVDVCRAPCTRYSMFPGMGNCEIHVGWEIISDVSHLRGEKKSILEAIQLKPRAYNWCIHPHAHSPAYKQHTWLSKWKITLIQKLELQYLLTGKQTSKQVHWFIYFLICVLKIDAYTNCSLVMPSWGFHIKISVRRMVSTRFLSCTARRLCLLKCPCLHVVREWTERGE